MREGYCLYTNRKPLYEQLEHARESKVLVYVTGNRPGLEIQMHSEILPFLTEHLDVINKASKITLVLHTLGGETIAAWSIVSLIRQFCNDFEVIVPIRAQSAGTLVCLGANRIVLTKQAVLGPVDPSFNGPLNPIIPGSTPSTTAVSVEEILGFIELAREELGITDTDKLTQVLLSLSDKVHPLVLGRVYRSRSQIKMLARNLLVNQVKDEDQIQKIISFLVTESGSHDYTINRNEAMNLGLVIDKPNDDLYDLIKAIYQDISNELELTTRWDAALYLGQNSQLPYHVTRGLIESVNGSSDKFITEGILTHNNGTMTAFSSFEGWRHEQI